MPQPEPGFLVSTDWLASHLDDANLRILDSTVYLRAPAPDADRRNFTQESGRTDYEAGHIPGALFADLVRDFSDTSAKFPFTKPSAEQFAASLGALGVNNNTHVVCYDGSGTMWATRMWWLLRAFGHDNASVLDGGIKKWTAEGRPTSTEIPAVQPAQFTPNERPERWATKDDVLAAINDGQACVINSLTEEQHAGSTASYGRPGHIAGSVNVSSRGLTEPSTGAYLPLDTLRTRFESAGASSAGRIITYCGGGIAATSGAFVLALLGQENVAVYDNSLSEWGRDESLPMETEVAAG